MESGSLFSVLHQVFACEDIEELKKAAVQDGGLSEAEFKSVLAFTCGIFCNMGNYKGFGDSKIIPAVAADKMETFLTGTKAFKQNADLVNVWNGIKEDVYDLSARKQQLGLGEKGVSTYFSPNCTTEDAEIVNRYLKSIQMEAYNSRVVKSVQDSTTHYEVSS